MEHVGKGGGEQGDFHVVDEFHIPIHSAARLLGPATRLEAAPGSGAVFGGERHSRDALFCVTGEGV